MTEKPDHAFVPMLSRLWSIPAQQQFVYRHK